MKIHQKLILVEVHFPCAVKKIMIKENAYKRLKELKNGRSFSDVLKDITQDRKVDLMDSLGTLSEEESERAKEKTRKLRKNFEDHADGAQKIGVKGIVLNEEGEVLVLKRSEDETHLPCYWDVPGGKAEYGDSIKETLRKETKEEAGIEIKIEKPVNTWNFMRDDGLQILGVTFLCKAETTTVSVGDEHTEFKWADHGEVEQFQIHEDLKETVLNSLKRQKSSEQVE